MRIAIPIWEDRISPVLDTASRLLIVEFEGQSEASRFETLLNEHGIHRRCLFITRSGVEILICGGISRTFFDMLTAFDVRIIPGISGHPDEVLTAYFKGVLNQKRFLMPGYRGNRIDLKEGSCVCNKPCWNEKRKKDQTGRTKAKPEFPPVLLK